MGAAARASQPRAGEAAETAGAGLLRAAAALSQSAHHLADAGRAPGASGGPSSADTAPAPANRRVSGPRLPAECVALATVVRVEDGRRGYVFTAIDLYSRMALALAPPQPTSAAAVQFLDVLEQAFPMPIRCVLTDNGSEFQGRFADALARRGIAHWHTYPNCPRMNAHVERFNRTRQEDFVEADEELLWADLPRFNRRLWGYLGWYNRERPHRSLGLRTPFAALADACASGSEDLESRKWWRLTHPDAL